MEKKADVDDSVDEGKMRDGDEKRKRDEGKKNAMVVEDDGKKKVAGEGDMSASGQRLVLSDFQPPENMGDSFSMAGGVQGTKLKGRKKSNGNLSSASAHTSLFLSFTLHYPMLHTSCFLYLLSCGP